MDWFRDGTLYVAVETGQPSDAVRIGVGDTREEARASLQATPMQSTGRDCVAAALRWALGAGWVEGPLEGDDA